MNAAAVGLIGVIVGALLTGVINLILDRARQHAFARVASRLIGEELRVAEQKVRSAIDAGNQTSERAKGPPLADQPQKAALAEPRRSRDVGLRETGVTTEVVPAVDKWGWWLGDLPTDAWNQHQSRLATHAGPALMGYLASAYATCASLNDQHQAAGILATSQGPLQEIPHGAVTGPIPGGLFTTPPGDLGRYAERLKDARELLEKARKLRMPPPPTKSGRGR